MSFVVAGFETLIGFLQSDLPDDWLQVCNRLVPYALTSFGTKVSKRNIKQDKYSTAIGTLIESYMPYQESNTLMIDSGGFQVITGKVPRHLIPTFREEYQKFLRNYSKYYSFAFTLDAPTISDAVNLDELEQLNVDNYSIIKKLPAEIQKKQIFITHSATYNDFNIWMKLIHKHELINYYENYSVGGLVSSRPQTKKLYYNLINLGLMQLLSGIDLTKLDKFRFHILGSSTSKNLIYFSLLEKHLERLLDKPVIVTFDSSAVFTKVQRSRTLSYPFIKEGSLQVIQFSGRSSELDFVNPVSRKTNREMIIEIITNLIDYVDLSNKYKVDENIYTEDNETISKQNRIWFLLMEIYVNNFIYHFYRQKASNLYQLYIDSPHEFYNELLYHYKLHKSSYRHGEMVVSSLIQSFQILEDFTAKNFSVQFVEDFANSVKHILDSGEEATTMDNYIPVFSF